MDNVARVDLELMDVVLGRGQSLLTLRPSPPVFKTRETGIPISMHKGSVGVTDADKLAVVQLDAAGM